MNLQFLILIMLIGGLTMTIAIAEPSLAVTPQDDPNTQIAVTSQTAGFEVLFQAWNAPYKIALTTSSNADGDKNVIRNAVSEARTAWYRLLNAYYAQSPRQFKNQAEWQESLAAITGYMHIAEWQMAAGHTTEAHRALGAIRPVWLDLRQHNHIAFYGDTLFEYHNIMEAVCDPIIAAPEVVKIEDLKRLESGVESMQKAWQKVLAFNLPLNTQAARQKHTGLVMQETEAITNFQIAVKNQDFANIGAAARAVKTAYRNLYVAFG
jgi:hypothetical protein